MTKNEVNIVWLKRDLRTKDHQPFFEAEKSKIPYITIFIFEPSLISHPDTSLRHLQFQYFSIMDMNLVLDKSNQKVEIFWGEAKDIFADLLNQFNIKQVFSYQETGIQKSFDRDIFLKKYFNSYSIIWSEFQRDGVVRGKKNRNGWDKQWFGFMHAPLFVNDFKPKTNLEINNNFQIPTKNLEEFKNYSKEMQPGGESNGIKYLQSFVAERGNNYSKFISKPHESRKSCGRLSPYLAWGNLSIRLVYHFVKTYSSEKLNKKPFDNFLTRLHWHCHFIQKFEMECRYETECVNRGYELLEFDKNEELLNAWKTGQTGFPIVDACMRCLIQTGWINFRMRAMVVSFLCHHLLLNWKDGVYHLAQLFLDYEPGIHYLQFQMQAGTTGINTIRIYNPIKNSLEHDSLGKFIYKWVPELQKIDVLNVHQPWNLSELEQQFIGFKLGVNYSFPVVNLEINGKIGKEKIWNHRKNELVKKENIRILSLHTRAGRKSENNDENPDDNGNIITED